MKSVTNGDPAVKPLGEPLRADAAVGDLTGNTLHVSIRDPFTSAPGTLTATLRTLAPDSTLVVGLSLGTWNGSSCQIVLANDNATQGAVVVGNASTTTNLCARIYDVGSVVEPVSYQIDVVHN